MSKLKLKNLLTEKKPWQGYKAHAVHGKAEVDFLNLISDFPDWKKYNKLTDKGKNVIFFMRKGKDALVWQTSNGREVQATNLKGDESSYKSYRLGDIYKILIEGKLNEAGIDKSYKAIMDLEKEILNMEKTFKREKSGMTRDRASKMEKSIKNLKQCWNNLYADTQER